MEITDKYIEYLKGGFYKCLCLFEEDDDGLSSYITSFSYEIYGLQYLVSEGNEIIITLLSILEHFYDDSLEPHPDIRLIRKEVFHCITLVNRLFKVGDIS